MTISDTITSNRRRTTSSFASRLLHKALSERDKKNTQVDLYRSSQESSPVEKFDEKQEKDLAISE